MRFEKKVNKFVDWLFVKGFSGRTQDTYKKEIVKFISFLDEHYPRIDDLAKITFEIVGDFSNYLAYYRDSKGKALTSKTQRLKLFALKKFFYFLVLSDFILKDPTLRLELPKEEMDLPKNVLTEKEVMRILEAPDMRTPHGIRNKAIIELAYSSGIRTSELCSLKIHDVDLKEMTVIVIRGKGGKTRVLPIGQYAVEYIRLYLEKSRKYMLRGKSHDDGYLFLSSRGQPFNRETVNKCVIRPVVKLAKIKKKVTYYSFRHAVASHLIHNKVDIRYVQQLLGHSSLKTTQKYCHLDITDLKKVHSLCHPREKTSTPPPKKKKN